MRYGDGGTGRLQTSERGSITIYEFTIHPQSARKSQSAGITGRGSPALLMPAHDASILRSHEALQDSELDDPPSLPKLLYRECCT